MEIMRGDACTIHIEIMQGQTPVTPEMADDLEVCLDSRRFRKTYGGGGVTFDSETGKWGLRLSQEDTFGLDVGRCRCIARVRYKGEEDFDVRGVYLGDIRVKDTISSEVLG